MMKLGGIIRTAAVATWEFVTATAASIAAGVKAAATWVAETAAMVAHKVAALAVAAASRIATAAQWLWNVALDANPIGLVVLAIGALVAAIVLVATHTKQIGQAFSAAWTWMKNVALTGIKAITGWLTGFVDSMKRFAIQAVAGFINGFKDFGKKLIDAVGKPVSDAVDWIKNKLGIHSPSRVTHEIGQNFTIGLADGIISAKDVVTTAASDVANAASTALKDGLYNVSRTEAASALQDSGALGSSSALGIDPKQLTDAVLGDSKAWSAIDSQVKKQLKHLHKIYGISVNPSLDSFMGTIQAVKDDLKAKGINNDLFATAVGGDSKTGAKVSEAAKALAEKIKKAAQLAKDAMKAWSMDEVVKPITTSFDQMLSAIQSQIQATANFMNNLATLKSRGLNGAALSSILGMGAAQGGGFAAALAGATDAQLAQYNSAYAEQTRLTGILGGEQAGTKNIKTVTIAEGAIQVSVGSGADSGSISDAMQKAIDQLVRELRSA